MQAALRYILIFIVLLAGQEFVLNHIFIAPDFIFNLAQPVIAFYIILLLPVMPVWAMLLAGFGAGLFIDIFCNGGITGIDMAACTAIAFGRNSFLKLIKTPDQENAYSASMQYLGFTRYLIFLLVICFLYHLIRQFLIVFNFDQIFISFVRIVINTILSVALLYFFEIIFFYRRDKA